LKVKSLSVFRELYPHRPDYRYAFFVCKVELSVPIVNQFVTLEDGIFNYFLNRFDLEEWFSTTFLNVAMPSEERIEGSKLIKQHIELIGWSFSEAWNISSSERNSRDT